jgi:hypothetical protein
MSPKKELLLNIVSASVNVHGVSSNLDQRNRVVEHPRVRSEDGPIGIAHTVTTFATVNCCKIERPVNLCVRMCEVNVLPKWVEFVMRRICLGSVGRPDKMSVTR